MELTTRFDSAANLRVHHLSGHVGLEAVCEALAELYTDPAYRPHQNSLWDVREARLASLSAADLRRLAAFLAGSWGLIAGPPKSAVVVSGAFSYDLARQFQMNLEGQTDVRVFRDITEATAWLGSGN